MAKHLSHEELTQASLAIEGLGSGTAPRGVATFARVLVATDGGPASDAAIEWARELGRDAAVWVVHVPEDISARPRAIVEAARTRLGLAADRAVTAFGDPATAIARLADDLRAEVTIVGSHGRGAGGRIILGSVSDAVSRSVRTSVLVAKAPPSLGPIVCGIDGSANATRAAGIAARLAAWRGTDLVLLHVLSSASLATARAWRSPSEGALTEVVTSGDPAETIIAEADARAASLVVMGARGHGRVRSTILGSVSAAVCHRSSTSVLVVRGPVA